MTAHSLPYMNSKIFDVNDVLNAAARRRDNDIRIAHKRLDHLLQRRKPRNYSETNWKEFLEVLETQARLQNPSNPGWNLYNNDNWDKLLFALSTGHRDISFVRPLMGRLNWLSRAEISIESTLGGRQSGEQSEEEWRAFFYFLETGHGKNGGTPEEQNKQYEAQKKKIQDDETWYIIAEIVSRVYDELYAHSRQYDIDLAHRNRETLASILRAISNQQSTLSHRESALLQEWASSIVEILGRGSDPNWNFYDSSNWLKTHDKFTKIRRGKRRPSLSSRTLVKKKPYTLIKEGAIVEEFQPDVMIAGLKLTTVFEGRRNELLRRLGKIDTLVRENPVDLDCIIAWNTPLVKFIEKNSLNYTDNERWRTIVVVMNWIQRYLETHEAARNISTFLETFPYQTVLAKMGIDSEATPAYRSLGRLQRSTSRSHFAASLSRSDQAMTPRKREIYLDGY
ncbi:hypothetical protein JCM3765_002514 [Sporobolomyces pararoseus]